VTAGPLSGVRVVDMGIWHAGPGGAAILGDLGADVIKVEAPGGDPERIHGRFGRMAGMELPLVLPDWSMLFEMSNRSKRGIVLDMKSESSRPVLERLVAGADIVTTNVRLSTQARLGVDFESLRTYNDRLVYVNVSGYGETGPYADLGGFDPLGQAVSGMAMMTGDDEPRPVEMIVLDQLTSITASHAALAGLVARDRTGEAQAVYTSLYGAATWLQHANLLATSWVGRKIELAWDRSIVSPLRSTFRCQGDDWIIGTNHPPEKYWEPFCRAIDRVDLLVDERFDQHEKRVQRSAELIAVLDETFVTRSRDDWLERLHDAGLLFAPVNSLQDVLVDEQAVVNGYVRNLEHPLLGELTVPGYPARFEGLAAGTQCPAPRLGQHTADVLAELGFSADEVTELREAGAFGDDGGEA
jgi:crotonobetainyl-CoA:carnitine CoA-transferase CaiB-like acyl-CoA transferase